MYEEQMKVMTPTFPSSFLELTDPGVGNANAKNAPAAGNSSEGTDLRKTLTVCATIVACALIGATDAGRINSSAYSGEDYV